MQRARFREEQYFSNPGLWVFVVVVFTLAIAPTVIEIYRGFQSGSVSGDIPSDTMPFIILLIILAASCIAVIILFNKMKLVVEVKPAGLFYRYPPFIVRHRFFLKEDIDAFEIRKFKAIKEYSGWGISYSWAKSGRAFSVKGNIGLQLYLKNGKKVLFGTQRPDALKRAMDKMMEEK